MLVEGFAYCDGCGVKIAWPQIPPCRALEELSEREVKIWLNEYKQANDFYRHHDIMGWAMAIIFIPASFAILAHAATIEKHYLPLSIVSVTILLVWIGMFLRMSDYTKPRQTRIFEIEHQLHMDHHLRVDNFLKAQRKIGSIITQIRLTVLKIHELKWILLAGLIIAWLVLIFEADIMRLVGR